MQTLPVGEFKSHFSEVLEQIKEGKEFVISYGKQRKKLAALIPYKKFLKRKNARRRIGILERKAGFKISGDFKMSEQEFLQS